MSDYTRIQTWPRGKMYEYKPVGQGFTIRDDDGEHPATAAEWLDIRAEELAVMYHERDLLANQCCLVDDLLKRGDIEGFTIDDIEGLYPDPSEWDAEELREWLDEHGHDYDKPPEVGGECPDCVAPKALVSGDGEGNVKCSDPDDEGCGFTFDDGDADTLADEWREIVTDNAEAEEVMQWWLVDSWLAGQLGEIGEPIIDNDYGPWWGRTCCGQGVLMDGTLQRIARRHIEAPAEVEAGAS